LSSPTIALGGTLAVTNINPGAPLVAGDTFKLFNTANLSGSFSSTILPFLNSGLAWDTTQLSSSGLIAVVTSTTPPSPGITNIVVTGGNLVLRGTASLSLANKTYYELSSTNAALPRTNWTVVLTNTFDANGGFSVTNPVNPNTRSRFFLIDIPWPQ
jgi:hypothetical protein